MKKLIFLLAIIVLAIVVIGIIFTDEPPRDESSHSYYVAYKFCKRYAPSGKNFTTDSGGDVMDGKAIWMADTKTWFSTGYVDAQNKFGALRHQRWAAHVLNNGTNWVLKYLTVGDDTLYNSE
ncbi:MAG: hypothetical protein WCH99_08935 [Verrucomicrobiota bacterium]